MIRVLFLCHGNICRSPMSEFIFRDMVTRRGLSDCFHIASAATSREEIGNPVYPPARRILKAHGIDCSGKTARQMTRADYQEYDYLLAAENYNIRNMMRILGSDPDKKVHRLLDFSKSPRDIADPWYTGDFQVTWDDIVEGCEAFLKYLEKEGMI
ncbi:MAG: low molecular weight phosphotyrosine protein phosphatase [Lachnospiraceae bacterium]|nr:low molecular weight phosphotyrosine protein phosphatase [Lachnospiraceae bacterium]